MPKESGVEGLVPRLYKRNALNLLMFGYVSGVRSTLSTVTIKSALCMFMEEFDLSHDDYNIDSGLVIYDRMRKDLFNINKSS